MTFKNWSHEKVAWKKHSRLERVKKINSESTYFYFIDLKHLFGSLNYAYPEGFEPCYQISMSCIATLLKCNCSSLFLELKTEPCNLLIFDARAQSLPVLCAETFIFQTSFEKLKSTADLVACSWQRSIHLIDFICSLQLLKGKVLK